MTTSPPTLTRVTLFKRVLEKSGPTAGREYRKEIIIMGEKNPLDHLL